MRTAAARTRRSAYDSVDHGWYSTFRTATGEAEHLKATPDYSHDLKATPDHCKFLNIYYMFLTPLSSS
jgi:hypothetical protein